MPRLKYTASPIALVQFAYPVAALAQRLHSLDVFRGLTIAFMILVNNPGSWKTTYAPLLHAEWHGWTVTDMVFPSFLWIVGVALTLSFARRVDEGQPRGRLLAHTCRRAALLFLLGLFLNGFPAYTLATLRIPGVLQRIAVCYLIAAAIYLYTGVRGRIAAVAVVFGLYWLLMHPGGYEKDTNFARHVDSLFLSGHMWSATKTWDPEGIVSTLPAIATALFGVLAGDLLRTGLDAARKTAWLYTSGCALLTAGLLWDLAMPINKNLWTNSYALFAAGFSTLVFAACYWFLDVLGWRRGTRPLALYGLNAIAVYVLSGLFARAMGMITLADTPLKAHVFAAFERFANPYNASLLYALLNVTVLYGAAWVMHRKGWYLRI
ncbi:MAG: DUF5009 domain-containing protein [Bryobacterales bacterium]|nr:DUF5009 domain-containing protein [Bryobacterales bacterium]